MDECREAPVRPWKRPETLSAWVEMFGRIYDEHDEETYPADKELLARLYEECLRLLEPLRKEQFEKIRARLPYLFVWFVACLSRAKVGLARAAWHKYPAVCPYRFEEENCTCIIIRGSTYRPDDPRLISYREDIRKMPQSLYEWQSMFRHLFGACNERGQTTMAVLCHLGEEAQEFGEQFRFGNKGRMEEAADFFAWWCGAATKLGIQNAEDLLWRHYPGVCDVCALPRCRCPKV